MGFVLIYRVVWALKALWIISSETINILRKLRRKKKLGCPRKCFHRVMYIAPSSGHEWLNLNLSLELILMRFEAVFWCLEWQCCTFEQIDEKSFKSTNWYYAMAWKSVRMSWRLEVTGRSVEFFPRSTMYLEMYCNMSRLYINTRRSKLPFYVHVCIFWCVCLMI